MIFSGILLTRELGSSRRPFLWSGESIAIEKLIAGNKFQLKSSIYSRPAQWNRSMEPVGGTAQWSRSVDSAADWSAGCRARPLIGRASGDSVEYLPAEEQLAAAAPVERARTVQCSAVQAGQYCHILVPQTGSTNRFHLEGQDKKPNTG